MPKARLAVAYPGQFCEPIFPDPRQKPWRGRAHLMHRIVCCDCGLAHDFEFIIVETAVHRGRVVMVREASRRLAIQFRVRRNERSTAQLRRRKQRVKVRHGKKIASRRGRR